MTHQAIMSFKSHEITNGMEPSQYVHREANNQVVRNSEEISL